MKDVVSGLSSVVEAWPAAVLEARRSGSDKAKKGEQGNLRSRMRAFGMGRTISWLELHNEEETGSEE